MGCFCTNLTEYQNRWSCPKLRSVWPNSCTFFLNPVQIGSQTTVLCDLPKIASTHPGRRTLNLFLTNNRCHISLCSYGRFQLSADVCHNWRQLVFPLSLPPADRISCLVLINIPFVYFLHRIFQTYPCQSMRPKMEAILCSSCCSAKLLNKAKLWMAENVFKHLQFVFQNVFIIVVGANCRSSRFVHSSSICPETVLWWQHRHSACKSGTIWVCSVAKWCACSEHNIVCKLRLFCFGTACNVEVHYWRNWLIYFPFKYASPVNVSLNVNLLDWYEQLC